MLFYYAGRLGRQKSLYGLDQRMADCESLGAFHYAKDFGNFGRNSNGGLVSVSSDRNIRDHLWRWFTHFGQNIPTETRRSIDLPQVDLMGTE